MGYRLRTWCQRISVFGHVQVQFAFSPLHVSVIINALKNAVVAALSGSRLSAEIYRATSDKKKKIGVFLFAAHID